MEWGKDIGFCHPIDGNVMVTFHNRNTRTQVWTIPGSWLCCLDWTPLVCSHSPTPFFPAAPPQGHLVAAVWCHCEHSTCQKQLKGERSQAHGCRGFSPSWWNSSVHRVFSGSCLHNSSPGMGERRRGRRTTPGPGSNLQSPLSSDLFVVDIK